MDTLDPVGEPRRPLANTPAAFSWPACEWFLIGCLRAVEQTSGQALLRMPPQCPPLAVTPTLLKTALFCVASIVRGTPYRSLGAVPPAAGEAAPVFRCQSIKPEAVRIVPLLRLAHRCEPLTPQHHIGATI